MRATSEDQRIAGQITQYYAVAGMVFAATGIAMILYLPGLVGVLLFMVGVLALAAALLVWKNPQAVPPAERWWKVNMLEFWQNILRGNREGP